MERQVAWAAGRPGEEDRMLNTHADTQAYYGRLEKRATSPGAPLTPPCGRMPKKPAPSGSPFRRSARLSSATWLLPGKPSPAR
jgi:hypothetical protein